MSHCHVRQLSGKGDYMSDLGDVTLYVPCYNSRRYLPEVIEALCAQDYPVAEFILVDDGCTDGSGELAQQVAARSGKELRVMRHARNRGLACARNTALDSCRTEFLAGVDSDVSPSPGWLRSLMMEFGGDENLAGVGGCTIDKYAATAGDRWRATHLRLNYDGMAPADPPYLFGANHVFRTRRLIEVGGYEERQRRAGEDVSICTRLKCAGHRLRYVPAARCLHLRRDTVWSALATYWRWKYFGNWSDDRSLRRVLRAACGDGTKALFRLLASDLRRRDYRNAGIDLLYPLVSLLQHGKACKEAWARGAGAR